MTAINAWAAHGPKEKLVPYKFDPGPLKAEEVEVKVQYCGVCHSDLSIINNEWGLSQYPLIPGHEIVGKIVALGDQTKGLKIGQSVGIGWNSESDMHTHNAFREISTFAQRLSLRSLDTLAGSQTEFAPNGRGCYRCLKNWIPVLLAP